MINKVDSDERREGVLEMTELSGASRTGRG